MVKVLELFAGIGACSKALENLGIPHEIVDAVEIDKYAIKSFNAIHGTFFEPQDITKWDKDIQADLVMHGSPCQDFSVAGKQAGGDKGSGTRSSLMYETLRIVGRLKPKYVIWENVKNLLSKRHRHNLEAYIESMDQLGYHSVYQVLNSKDYGIPQSRARVFTISIRNDIDQQFEFPPKQELKLRLKDVLEDEVDERYYLSEERTASLVVQTPVSNLLRCIGRVDAINGHDILKRVYSPDGISPTLSTMGGGNQEPKIVVSRVRREGQRLELCKDNLTDAITSAQKDNYVAAVDDIYKSRPPIVYREIVPTIRASRAGDPKVIHISKTMTTEGGTGALAEDIRVRKLTPKECWRLMGFSDEDFEKAAEVNSKTQLYKQAGNSIVVNVLEEILGGLYRKQTRNENPSNNYARLPDRQSLKSTGGNLDKVVGAV